MTAKTKARTQAASSTEEKQLEHPRLGDVVYSEEDKFFFPQGLLGFEKNKHYIIEEREEYYPFLWMISTDKPDTSFVLVNPFLFVPDYKPTRTKRDMNELEIENPQSLLMYVIVTLNRDVFQSTANLRAPVLINASRNIGKQLVLLDDQYSTKHPILRTD